MRFSLLITLVTFVFFGCQTMSKNPKSTAATVTTAKKIPPSVTQKPSVKSSALAQKTIYEELTGNKVASSKQMAGRILELARDAKWKRDYITALKRYNTVIVKFPKSKEAREAYLDKAALYKEMGLIQQSKMNLEKANK